MNGKPYVQVALFDGTDTCTWVSRAYLQPSYPPSLGALNAAGDAFTGFVASLVRDEEVLDERLGSLQRQACPE